LREGGSALADDRSGLFRLFRGAATGDAGEGKNGRERERHLLHLKYPDRIVATGRDGGEVTRKFFTESIAATGFSRAARAFHVTVTPMPQRRAADLSPSPETAMLAA
jgi:hypothetical protein